MIPRGRPRRWRPTRPRASRPNAGELELLNALEIIELLAVHPSGLTIPEIVACLRKPAGEVVRSIALLQRRRWLRPNAHDAWLMHEHLSELTHRHAADRD
jgi:DNA-binding IclR family transcriptional regulator